MTCANGVAPVLFPITNVTISSNGYTQTRGIQTGIGTPNQIFALWPATSVNNVIISNSAGCGPSTNYSCYGSYGGSFDTSKSGTYDMMTLAQWNGNKSELEEADADLSFIYFQDEIRLSDNSLLPSFPMAMTSPTDPTQGSIPLASDSTFLRTLAEQNLAPSRAWGYWAGSRSVLAPQDGLLVIGGYDHNRIATGARLTNFTSNPKYQWYMTIHVTNMTYDTGQGPMDLFNSSSQAFDSILNTASADTLLPEGILNTFGNVTGANKDAGTEVLSWPASDGPTGNVTVTLDDGADGYQFIIPWYELFHPDRKYDDKGSYVYNNDSFVFTSFASADVVSGGISWFGDVLFQANYLVNLGGSSFQLAPANTSNAYAISYPKGLDIKPICNETQLAATGSSSGTNSTSSSSISGGVIAGIVVGCIAAVAIVAVGLCYWLWRRRRRQRQRMEGSAVATNTVEEDPLGKAELDSAAAATVVPAPRAELAPEEPAKVELPAGAKPQELGHADGHAHAHDDTTTVSTLPVYSRQETAPVEMPAKPCV
ncbi:hypothetical protein LTR96_001820 [Exophiala xenobiotica]|nr:hypothetical protein LTR96_001820 [Exophiala xenobiotica]KAK5342126.1 hypothetical protein LTR98_002920 [Exophiala xenobiotica]